MRLGRLRVLEPCSGMGIQNCPTTSVLWNYTPPVKFNLNPKIFSCSNRRIFFKGICCSSMWHPHSNTSDRATFLAPEAPGKQWKPRSSSPCVVDVRGHLWIGSGPHSPCLARVRNVLEGSTLEKRFRWLCPNSTVVNVQIAEIYGCSSQIW